jgi:ferredoxin
MLDVYHGGRQYRLQTYRNEHPSLMALISHCLDIPGFGLCSGMGSCGTCRVTIEGPGYLPEGAFLACDIQVNDYLANTGITIPDSRY